MAFKSILIAQDRGPCDLDTTGIYFTVIAMFRKN